MHSPYSETVVALVPMAIRRDVFTEQVVIWDDFRQGDLNAFTWLYTRYVNRLYGYGKRMGAASAMVEDCIQDLFVELWYKKEHLGPTTSPENYLLTAVHNKILRRLSQSKKFVEQTLEDKWLSTELSYETALIDEQSGLEQQARIRKAILQLTKRQQEVIFLRFYECLSYPQIASRLSVEVRHVYNLVSLAINALKHCLSGSSVE